ncbi:low molecular weight protein-tyrosine-phosphatase [Mesorhizobium sp. NPDC059054]|uniref:low molecular weight protein-tyrosine-phosphatase n=1 Tax=Mesorhizobium sp. NPDC059054 TaxID=3346711 RepID=UPI003684BBE6
MRVEPQKSTLPRSVLFVCLGNICRSPLAEGVFREVLVTRGMERNFLLDSAGTGGWHAGSAPDPRSIEIAARHGIDISGQKARKVSREDFARFDLIFGMDRSNVADLKAIAPEAAQGRIQLFLEFAGDPGREVTDPYYGGPEGFASVYRIIREASEAIATRLDGRVAASESGHASSTM